jgi:hypothetical protein
MQEFDLGRRDIRRTTRSVCCWGIGLILAATSFACSSVANDEHDLLDESPQQPAGELQSERLEQLDLGGQQLSFDWRSHPGGSARGRSPSVGSYRPRAESVERAPRNWISFEEQTVGIDDTSFFLCAGSPKVAGIGNPSGCKKHDNRRVIMVGLCNDNDSPDSTLWTYFLNNIAPLNGFSLAPGQVSVRLLNPQPLPPGVIVLPTRSLAIRSRNDVAEANRHRQKSGLSDM